MIYERRSGCMTRPYLDGDTGKSMAAAFDAQTRELMETLINAMLQNKKRQRAQVDASLLEAMQQISELSGFYELWRQGRLEELEGQLRELGLWPGKQLPDETG